MKNTHFQGILYPLANVAINKSRIKLYNSSDTPTYFLKQGQEFQIELFNPLQECILVRISLNNKLTSNNGLVLKPGERVFLDRYLDVDKKFLFDTYKVKDSKEAKKAIEANGDIKIDFFKEYSTNQFFLTTTAGTGTVTLPYFNGGYTNPSWSNICGTTTGTSYTNSNTTFTTTSTNNWIDLMGNATLDSTPIPKTRSAKKSIETGRIEQGSKSDQKFDTVNKRFETTSFHTINYKLLPISQKNVDSGDLVRKYCHECGTKLKSGYKFCPTCGDKQ